VKPLVVDDVVEGAETEVARSDARVEIAIAEERGFAVVDVQGFQVLESNHLVELGHCGSVGFRRAQVVASSKDVACVETDADARLVLYAVDDCCEVLEGAADGVTLRGHGLEDCDDGAAGGVAVGLVDVVGDVADAFFAGGSIGVAGVEVVELDAERVAAREIVQEGVVGLLLAFCVGMGEVDEV